MSRQLRLRCALLSVSAVLFSSTASAQWSDLQRYRDSVQYADSVARAFRPGLGTVGVQLLAGEAAFALPFWTLGGISQLQGGEGNYGGLLLTYVSVPLGVWAATNILHSNRGSLGLAYVGAVLSILPLAAFLPMPNKPFQRYVVTSTSLLLTSLLFYDLPMWLRHDS